MTQQPTNSTRLAVGDAAPDVPLRDDENRPVHLRELWQTAPLVLFFQRHLG